jgi:hypothetical protein
MPEDGQYGRNMLLVFTGLITDIVADGKTFIIFNALYHNEINSAKKTGSVCRKLSPSATWPTKIFI